jgi:acyl-CoA synthetase (AMP-forming)/AMP-acid ligase II
MNIFKSPLPEINIPQVPLTEFVLSKKPAMPNHPAIIDGTNGNTYSFSQLSDAIHRLAGGFRIEGFKEGSVLALISPNNPEFAVVFHAVAVCGGTVTTVNPTYGADEIRQQLIDSGATIAVTIPDITMTVIAAMEDTKINELVTIGSAPGFRSISDLMTDPVEQTPLDVFRNIVAMPYSSGTTGLPKGVLLSHHNLVSNLAQVNAAVDYEPGEVGLAVLPFFHIYGMQVVMGSLLAEGVTVVTVSRFDMEQVLSLIQQYRITQFFAVPPIVLSLAKHPIVDKYDISSLKKVFSGAAPLGSELTDEAANRIDCPIVQIYGMTEMSPVSHITERYNSKPGSNGVTVSNTSSRIIDQEGNDLGINETGELLVKGPQIMIGYLNNSQATAETLDQDGWLHTGDVARIDADGHMFIVDRVKELIKYKGFQVAPAELEAIIITHPAVADVAVIGVPDDEAGELPKAFVTLRANAHVSENDIMIYVNEQVASYKKVRQVDFIDSIPKSASGKILRRHLRDI